MIFFAWIGRCCINFVLYILDLTYFLIRTISVWQPHRHVLNRAVYLTTVDQLVLIGINAIAITSLLALFVGASIASQLIYVMQSLTTNNDLVAIIARLILSEMSPLVVGSILVSRSCSAIVVDLGNARMGGEIEPLEYMGINIDDYCVVPRIFSMVISQMALTLYFTALMTLSGVFFSAFLFGFSAQQSLTELLATLSLDDALKLMLKNIFFGLIIGNIACFHGLLVDKSVTLISEQMQKAMVRCFVFLLLADAYFIFFT